MRIDKLLSEMGLASRRECADLAKRGQLLVDGAPVRDPSCHIDPERQTVTLSGRVVEYSKYTYVMLNKPEGYVSATDDRSLPYVTELLPEEYRRRGLFPIGRLDRDTVGLMILTNDGALSHALLSPRHHVDKVYRFTADEPLPEGTEEKFRHGVTLADGYECKSAQITLDVDRLHGEIILTEGKYHQIKRMIAASGSHIIYLERIRFADIPLDPELARGQWRLLSADEIKKLRTAKDRS